MSFHLNLDAMLSVFPFRSAKQKRRQQEMQVLLSTMKNNLVLSSACIEAFQSSRTIWCSERIEIPPGDGEYRKPVPCVLLHDVSDSRYPYQQEVQDALSIFTDSHMIECGNPNKIDPHEIEYMLSLANKSEAIPFHIVSWKPHHDLKFAVLCFPRKPIDEFSMTGYLDGRGNDFWNIPAFIYNATHPSWSEFGRVRVKPKNEGLLWMHMDTIYLPS